MRNLAFATVVRRVGPPAVLLMAAGLLALLSVTVLSLANLCGDVVCFYAAGTILASGDSPYDAARQAAVQAEHGWDKGDDGEGRYAFMPYFYPPWFAILWVPLASLTYPAAKAVWLVAGFFLILAAGYVLKDLLAGIPKGIPMMAAVAFAPSVLAVFYGQTTPLILFLIVAAWRLLECRHDRAAGVVLAWLTIKPQLTVVVLSGLAIWVVRRRRWGVAQGAVTTLAVLVLASTWLVPSWPVQMIEAPRIIPPPTAYFPWSGATWYLLLKTLGLESWPFAVLYLAAALPATLAVLRAAWDRSRPLHDVIALGLLAAFFVAPYAQFYDDAILLVPALVLRGSRLPGRPGVLLVATLILVPYLFLLAPQVGLASIPSVAFLWIPVLLSTLWWLTSLERPSAVGGSIRSPGEA